MSQKSYYYVTGGVFLIIAVLHLLRIVNSWPVNIADFAVPIWLSWLGVLLAGVLAYYGLRRKE